MNRMPEQILGGLKIPRPTFSNCERESLGLPSISQLHPFHPGLGYLYDISGDSTFWLSMDNQFRMKQISQTEATSKLVDLKVLNKSTNEILERKAFMKTTHLLDPITWIRGKYGIEQEENNGFFLPGATLPSKVSEKLEDPMNQAYVEAIATYCLSKLREADVSPHFHYFYGAYRGVSDNYSYNISDVFSTYRQCRWFWNNQEQGVFELETDVTDAEVQEAIFDPPSELHSEVSSEASEETEELDDILPNENENNVELQSLHSTSMSDVDFKSERDSNEDDETYKEEDEDDMDDDEDMEAINVFANIKKFPVMLMFTEPSEGTMDDLLAGCEEGNPGDKQWESMWTAWIFQILAALSVLQTFFGFTHNDLHTNNIVWAKTDQKYFFYTNRDGTVWRVPTFGRVFRIIDFGRSIFSINDKLFFSDDFKEGNDAAEQFNFGPLQSSDPNEPEAYPNPSFDLCRLAVSLFENLFPVKPAEKKGGALLSHEPGLKVKETVSDLYNLLWSWMIDDDGRNVLMEANGRERYPDFDLYKVITQKISDAIPKEQIKRPIFDRYRVGKKNVPKSARLYNLFF